MYKKQVPRNRKNIVVTNRNKNNIVSTDFQNLIKTRPNTTSREDYKAPISTNEDDSKASTL